MMRSLFDRLRHTFFYELLLLAISTPLLASVLHRTPTQVGGLGILLSLLAMMWNLIYNLAFDKTLLGLKRPLYPRGLWLRGLHAALFEIGFMAVSVPAVSWWMDYSLWQALVLDAAFVVIVPLYTLAYNWGYDLLFPVPAGVIAERVR